ncbi:hypothetical protein, partial [Klebsiella pneumoniae]
MGQLTLRSDGDLMLQAFAASGAGGRISTAADLSLNARQIYPASDTPFTIDATGRRIDISMPAGDAPDQPW